MFSSSVSPLTSDLAFPPFLPSDQPPYLPSLSESTGQDSTDIHHHQPRSSIFFPTPPPVPTPCSIGASPATCHRTSLPFASTVVAGPSLLHLHTPLSPRRLFLSPLELHQQSTAVPALFLERHRRSPPTRCHLVSNVPTYLFFPSLSLSLSLCLALPTCPFPPIICPPPTMAIRHCRLSSPGKVVAAASSYPPTIDLASLPLKVNF